MFKSNKGFTLVELIVVIAILAILAGVAIPVYNGYIKRANDAAVVTELDVIQTAAQAANATAGQITKIVVSADGKTIKVAGTQDKLADDFDSDFCLFYDNASDASANSIGVFSAKKDIDLGEGTYVTGATWKDGKWTAGVENIVDQSPANGEVTNGNPGGQEPGGQEPGGQEPGGQEPGGQEPGGQEPGGQEPGGDNPNYELPDM